MHCLGGRAKLGAILWMKRHWYRFVPQIERSEFGEASPASFSSVVMRKGVMCNDGGEDFLLGGSSIGSWEVRSRILVIEKDFIFLILRGAYIRNFNLIF